jgi:hypothetical protein
MENENTILDENILEVDTTIEPQFIISVPKFIILSIASLGMYRTWWQYKAWRYYKQKEKLDISPVARTIFSVFYLNSLFKKILESATEKGYTQTYSSVGLFIGVLVAGAISKLPQPFGLITILSFIFFIPPFKALNYAKQNTSDINVIEQQGFNGRQIGLIIFGFLILAVIIIALAAQKYITPN